MNLFVRFNQYILWIVFRVYLVCSGSHYKTLFEISDIPKDRAYLLTANHQRRVDPFIVGAGLPFRVYSRLLPIWFMGYRELFEHWYLRWPLLAFGSFPAKPISNLPSGLQFSTENLQSGGSVNIFPEGRRTKQGMTEPKRGVSILASLENVLLIPIHIEWSKRRLGQRVSIIYGMPQQGGALTPHEIMNVIYSL